MDIFLEVDGLLDYPRLFTRRLLLADNGHRHRLSAAPLRHILILLQHCKDDVWRALPQDTLRAGSR
jgi:hypothetical protein